MVSVRSRNESMVSDLDTLILRITMVVVACVLFAPLVVMADPLPETFFPFVVGKVIYTRILIDVALVLWLVLCFSSDKYRPRSSRLIWILVVYVVIVLLASLAGVSPQRSIWSTYERMQGFVDIAHWLAFIVVLTSVYRSWNEWNILLNFNLGVSCVIGVIGIGQFLDVRLMSYLRDAERIDISFGNPTYVGAYMLVSIAISLGFLARSLYQPTNQQEIQVGVRQNLRRNKRKRGINKVKRQQRIVSTEVLFRVFWIFSILLAVSAVVLSGTRGATVGLAGGLVVGAIGYLAWGHLRQVKLLAIGLLVTIFGLVLVVVLVRDTGEFKSIADNNYLLRRLSNIGPNDQSTKERLNAASVGLKVFWARPVLGWGPENFTIGFDRYVTADIIGTLSFDQAHNKLIEELTTKGLTGLVSYLAIWVYMMWIIVKTLRAMKPPDQLFVLFIGSGLIGYFIQNLFLFDTPGTVVQYFLLMGFVVHLEFVSKGSLAESAVPAGGVNSSNKPLFPGLVVLKTDFSKLLFGLVGLIIMAFIINLVNLGPLKGSRTVIQTLNPNITWEKRLNLFEESIGAFPSLANYPRQILFKQLSLNWSRLTPQEQRLAMDISEREGDLAIKGEPEEWRIYVALAGLFQKARSIDPSYLKRARVLANKTEQLAPNRVETHMLIAMQYMAEDNLNGALEAVNNYLSSNPELASKFVPTYRSIVQRFIVQQEIEMGLSVSEKFLATNPELATYFMQTYVSIIQAYIASGKPEAARDVFEGFVGKNPGLSNTLSGIERQIEAAEAKE